MKMKHSELAVEPIFEMQLDMLYKLFLDNLRIPKEVLQVVMSRAVSQFVFWFPAQNFGITDDNMPGLSDYRVTIEYHNTGKRERATYEATPWETPPDFSSAYEAVTGVAFEGSDGELDEEWDEIWKTVTEEAMDDIWNEAFFSPGSKKWDLDKYQKAILLNTDSLLTVAMRLFNAKKQLQREKGKWENGGMDIPVVSLSPNEFLNFRDNQFEYSIFINTVARYLQSVYTGYDFTVYCTWVLRHAGKDDYAFCRFLRSTKDQTGFEDAGIPTDIFPAVLPDFSED